MSIYDKAYFISVHLLIQYWSVHISFMQRYGVYTVSPSSSVDKNEWRYTSTPPVTHHGVDRHLTLYKEATIEKQP